MRRGPCLTNVQRQAVYQALLTRLDAGGHPSKGAFVAVAEEFRVHPRTVSRIWKRAVVSVASGEIVPDVAVRRSNSGRKKKPIDLSLRLAEVPPSSRTSIRALSEATGVPRSTLWRLIKAGALRRRASRRKNKDDQPYELVSSA
eukprot:CAMPEP_0185846286 /NCGR_PEP_ID=MMETSP1354-20130828/1979_1 /TAXON_ID=708628 /ORGANISM="Erythrolobus madagascarensis, Strain CCMP3276" /LENGTH=143 /DNA_ID=CAMNT_0028546395 /DNA_START=27 /DNA_END=458 /DNA_ORIENTATION=+